MTSRLLAAIATSVPSPDVRSFLALATLVFATLTQTGPVLALDESIPCDPEPTEMAISYSDAVSCSIDVLGDVDLFRFSGTAGDVITLLGSRLSGGIPCVELFDPAGGPAGSHCSNQGARINATLGQTGLYSILVSELSNDNTMDYTLVVERVAPPSISARHICPGCELQDNIDPIGDLELFFFSGTAGDVITLLGSRLSGGIPCVELFDPAGGPAGSHCSNQGARIDATLGQTGLYSILVSELSNDNTMDYVLSHQCIVGVCVDLCEAADGQNLTLQDDTVIDSQTFEVCGTIEVGPNYEVGGPNGFLTLRAGDAVIFKDGALVGVDSTLIVDIDPQLRPPPPL
jgi:hypothetical protein